MKKYVKDIDNETKKCTFVFDGTDIEWAISDGYEEQDVELAYDGDWYLTGYAPVQPAPTEEEQRQKREQAYTLEVDPITCHINRLKDQEQTPEVIAEIESLMQERDEKVEEIKRRYPYPVEVIS